jgi:SSS family solute:Na+ symporter
VVDLCVVLGYLLALTATGLGFAREQTSTEQYFVARRSIPAWAMGMSIVATLITSVTFIAYPGSAYEKDWSLLVPGFMVVGVLVLVGAVIIPFYRRVVGMSAYEYFGHRFGKPVRIYACVAFALGHFSKMGFVFYLLALTINSITGWNMDQVIVVAGLMTILYTLRGGLEAVIWTDVVQGFILWSGVLVTLAFLLLLPRGGPSHVLSLAVAHHKMRLGEWTSGFATPNLQVLVIYGFFWYLQKYTADQSIVQRYLVAKSDRAALRGVALGAVLCVPVWTLFMLIGTCTWSFYRITGERLPGYITKSDQIFPHFLATHLPPGMAGLVMAALMGSAMCALASDLNSFALVGVEDIYRQLRPESTDARRLMIGKVIVLVCGLCCIATALVLAHTKSSALSMWFTVSAIASGGLAGLFLLAFLGGRASRRGVWTGILAALAFTAWATLTLGEKRALDLGRWNFPWHDYMIGAIAHVVLLVVGYLASWCLPDPAGSGKGMTLWRWLRWRKATVEEP